MANDDERVNRPAAEASSPIIRQGSSVRLLFIRVWFTLSPWVDYNVPDAPVERVITLGTPHLAP